MSGATAVSPDPYWHAVRELLDTLPGAKGQVVLPAGDWGSGRPSWRYYRQDEIVAMDADVDVCVVHKGMIPSFRQSAMRWLLSDRDYVYGNEVFCVFARDDAGRSGDEAHVEPVRAYADPRRRWRDRPWRCSFLHVPKTAGTSLWSVLAAQVPANIYFTSDATLRAFDGDINEFELIGGHVHADTLREVGWIGHNFAMLRDPLERTLSFVAHARRLGNYSGHVDESFRHAGGSSDVIDDALRTVLFAEANQQVGMLGERAGADREDAAVLGGALARSLMLLDEPDWTFGTQDDMAGAMARAAAAFRVDIDDMPWLNRTEARQHLVAPMEPAVRALFADPDWLCCDRTLVEIARRRTATARP